MVARRDRESATVPCLAVDDLQSIKRHGVYTPPGPAREEAGRDEVQPLLADDHEVPGPGREQAVHAPVS